jgi:hypothetical protein
MTAAGRPEDRLDAVPPGPAEAGPRGGPSARPVPSGGRSSRLNTGARRPMRNAGGAGLTGIRYPLPADAPIERPAPP